MSGVSHGMLAAISGNRVELNGGNITDTQGSVAVAAITLENDGDEIHTETSNTDVGDWVIPKAAAGAGNYEHRLTVNSGDAPTSGASTATWLADSTSRTWTWTQSGSGSKTANVTLEIRDANSSVVLASESFTVTAIVP